MDVQWFFIDSHRLLIHVQLSFLALLGVQGLERASFGMPRGAQWSQAAVGLMIPGFTLKVFFLPRTNSLRLGF